MLKSLLYLIFNVVMAVMLVVVVTKEDRKHTRLQDHHEDHHFIDSIPVYYNDSITLQFLAVE